jgi:FdhD protein
MSGLNINTKGLNNDKVGLAQLVEEVPVAITINDIHYSVMLASPYDLEDFGLGYLLTEGVITDQRQVHDIEIRPIEKGLNLNITLANRQLNQFKHQQSQLKSSASCGLCGKQAMHLAFPALPKLKARPCLPLITIQKLRYELAALQTLATDCGAMHAAFWIDEYGALLACREDIGRHNAVDKIIGYSLVNQFEPYGASLLVTSRCSVEIVQKAIVCGVSTLITLASPTQLALDYALRHCLNLVHIPKRDAPYLLTSGHF